MSTLVACPFCRELFERSEAEDCPHCEIGLVPLARLPPSHEALEREAAEWERDGADDRLRSWFDPGAGRGALLAIATLGLLAFAWSPWVEISTPHAFSRSGYSLARGPLAWLWGGAIAWFTCWVLVATRRTLRQMRGVRAILALMSSMTLVEALMLLGITPEQPHLVPFVYEWAWGLYASLGLSLAGLVVSLRFGGPWPATPGPEASPAADEHSSDPPETGHTVH